MVLWFHHETLASSAVERKYGSSEDEMAFAGFQHAPALRKSERFVQASREQQAIINSLAEVCSRKESSSELPEAAAEVDAALTLDEREALPQEVPTKAAGGDEAVSAVGGQNCPSGVEGTRAWDEALSDESWLLPRLYVCSDTFPVEARIDVYVAPSEASQRLLTAPHGSEFYATGRCGDFLRVNLFDGKGSGECCVGFVPCVIGNLEPFVLRQPAGRLRVEGKDCSFTEEAFACRSGGVLDVEASHPIRAEGKEEALPPEVFGEAAVEAPAVPAAMKKEVLQLEVPPEIVTGVHTAPALGRKEAPLPEVHAKMAVEVDAASTMDEREALSQKVPTEVAVAAELAPAVKEQTAPLSRVPAEVAVEVQEGLKTAQDQLMQCAASVLRLYCSQRGISTQGNKKALACRLAGHCQVACEPVNALCGPGAWPMVPGR